MSTNPGHEADTGTQTERVAYNQHDLHQQLLEFENPRTDPYPLLVCAFWGGLAVGTLLGIWAATT